MRWDDVLLGFAIALPLSAAAIGLYETFRRWLDWEAGLRDRRGRR